MRRIDLPCGHVIHSTCVGAGGNQEYNCPSRCYETVATDQSLSSHVLLVSGTGNIEKLELSSPTHSSMMARLADRFGENFTDTKTVFCKDGLEY